jgi:hypothetical protein
MKDGTKFRLSANTFCAADFPNFAEPLFRLKSILNDFKMATVL